MSGATWRPWIPACALTVAAAMSACGTRLDHHEIVARAGNASAPTEALSRSAVGTRDTQIESAGLAPQARNAVAGDAGTGVAAAPVMTSRDRHGAAVAEAESAGSGRAALAPIVLGNVGTYSGPIGSSSAGVPDVLRIWAKVVNGRGGLAGHPVKISIEDDGSDPARTKAIVKDMVEGRRVVAFVGALLPINLGAVLPYLEQRHIPVVGGDVVTATWNQSPVLFPQGTAIENVVYGMAALPAATGAKRFGVLYCAEAAACAQTHDWLMGSKGFVTQTGMQPAYSAQISLAQPDFTAECLNAHNNNVDALGIAADVNTVGRVASSCARQGYRPRFVSLSAAVAESQAGNPALEGLVAPQPAFPWMLTTTAATAEYARVLRQFAPGLSSNGATAMAWTAAKLFERAARDAKDPTDASQVFAGLWGLKDETLGGLSPPLTFVAGKPAPPSRCYFVSAIKRGRWVAPQGDRTSCRPA